MRLVLIAVSALAAAGCVGPVAVTYHSVGQKRFSPEERRAVWGRAVTAFQARGSFISFSDSIGGVLRSEVQQTWMPCSKSWSGFIHNNGRVCPSVTTSQFTVTDDGNAYLRINRVVQGHSTGGAIFDTADLGKMQTEFDEMMRFIIGENTKPPEPLLQRDQAVGI